MTEIVYPLTQSEMKTIEKVVINQHLHYMHVILPEGESLPRHQSNANVYMTILEGQLTLALNQDEPHTYGAKTLLQIPFDTTMNVSNPGPKPVEFIIVKTPAPGPYYKQD